MNRSTLAATNGRPVLSRSSCAVSPRRPSLAIHTACCGTHKPTVYVVANERSTREMACDILEGDGYVVRSFADGASFLQDHRTVHIGCLLVDGALPGMSGLELIGRVKVIDPALPTIIMDCNATLATAILAMRAGAVDFVEKPFSSEQLLESVARVLPKGTRIMPSTNGSSRHKLPGFNLTRRQGQILELVLDGWPSKNIACDLGISQRTVENHRAAIMKKTGSRSVPALVRATLALV